MNPDGSCVQCSNGMTGVDQNGRAYGQFEATGVRPTFVNRLEQKGVKLPSNMFSERVLLRD